MYWTAAATSEHPAEAAAFINFMVNTVDAANIIKTDRGITANSAVRDAIASILTPLDQQAVDYQDGLDVGPPPVVTPNGASAVEAILQRYTQAVYFGEQTPEDAAQAFIDELQGEIDAAE